MTAAVRLASDPIRVMRRVIDEAMSLMNAAEGAVVEIADSDMLTYVCSPESSWIQSASACRSVRAFRASPCTRTAFFLARILKPMAE